MLACLFATFMLLLILSSLYLHSTMLSRNPTFLRKPADVHITSANCCSRSVPALETWCRMLAGFGFAVWVLGSVGCAVAPRFWVLILCRVVMGAGEASIITLSNPFIDDVAPPAQKTLWFGILNLVSPS